jgi:hypothetical protein
MNIFGLVVGEPECLICSCLQAHILAHSCADIFKSQSRHLSQDVLNVLICTSCLSSCKSYLFMVDVLIRFEAEKIFIVSQPTASFSKLKLKFMSVGTPACFQCLTTVSKLPLAGNEGLYYNNLDTRAKSCPSRAHLSPKQSHNQSRRAWCQSLPELKQDPSLPGNLDRSYCH